MCRICLLGELLKDNIDDVNVLYYKIKSKLNNNVIPRTQQILQGYMAEHGKGTMSSVSVASENKTNVLTKLL